MPRYRRAVESGSLPPLKFDWSHPSPVLLDTAVDQLARVGVSPTLEVEAKSDLGTATIPLLCDLGDSRWAPYIEPDAWDDDVTLRFVEWLSVVRASAHGDVRIQFYSRHAVPEIVHAMAADTPISRLQLDLQGEARPYAFRRNAALLTRRVEQYFGPPLPISRASLERLDAIISQHLGDHPPLLVTQALVHTVGCFLGETIMAAAPGGNWERRGDEWCVTPTLQRPLQLAVDRFANGPRAALSLCVLPEGPLAETAPIPSQEELSR